MNKVIAIGRVCADPEIRWANSDKPVAFGNYTIAVDRPKQRDADAITDFIPCKVVGKPAEFAEKYLRKGMKIAIEGRFQVDKYTDREGNTKYSYYVQVQSHEFCESKGNQQSEYIPRPSTDSDDFMNIPDSIDEELPFN